ncbi:heavy-metal-associated domain-containing protein [Tenacibaculum sp. IB213877]|uniref:heavy-metal-associated domain-containing protein n=1 Tax=Tenacibaculum sp. IB213877 TaxID=3097351 RepID=UPI002A5A486D|nr:cation transporter [Tenacibaculum sp. IB213877]MDY0780253.1 cation transporter [Tenacibaculum sp. IB213877]
MKKLLTIAVMLLMVVSVQAQKKNKNAKITVEVDGVCMMCKKRIEKAALNTKGVKFANWDVESHQLTLIMDERKTSKKMICENIAKVGHDTKEIKATQENYDNLHGCCKYRDEEIQEEH